MLTSRLTDLGEVTRQITDVSQRVDAATSQLTDAGTRLLENVSLAKETHTGVSGLRSDISEIKTKIFSTERTSDTRPSEAEVAPREVVSQIIEQATIGQLAIYRLVELAVKRKVELFKTFETVVSPLTKRRLEKRKKSKIGPAIGHYVEGIVTGHAFMLNDLGLIQGGLAAPTDLDPDFTRLLHEAIHSYEQTEADAATWFDVEELEKRFEEQFPEPKGTA